MKNIFTVLFLLTSIFTFAHGGDGFKHSDIFKTLGPNDKVAILMVHFGTTHDDTRALTIEAINKKVSQTFPGVEVREAYTSRMIMRRLKEKGMTKPNPTEAMNKLIADGYTHLILQPTNIIEGIEMEALQKEVASYQTKFKDIRLGTALLNFGFKWFLRIKTDFQVHSNINQGQGKRGLRLRVPRDLPPGKLNLRDARLRDESPRTQELPRGNDRRLPHDG